MQEISLPHSDRCYSRLATRVFLIVGSAFNHPIPGLQGLLASGEVLLRDEGLLILRDLAQVLTTIADSRCYRGEADASIEFAGARSRAALRFLAEVESVTVFRLGCCGTVRTKQHFCARVLSVLARFAERTGYTIDTGTPFYFCHSRSAIGSQRSIPLR